MGISCLRREAERQVEYLIALIDELDGDTDVEPEPVVSNYASNYGCDRIDQDEAEGDHGCDDREGDELLHGGDEHDGTEPDADGEPWLGWTTSGGWGLAATTYDGSYVTAEARARYRPYDRWETIRDGIHIDSERGCGANSRRIRNLSDRQRAMVLRFIDGGSGVTVSA